MEGGKESRGKESGGKEGGKEGGGGEVRSRRLFDVSKVEELLGRPLKAPEETLRDMVQAMIVDEEEEEEGGREGGREGGVHQKNV